MPLKRKVLLIGSIPPPYHGSSIYFENLLNSDLRDEFNITHLDISDHRDLDNLSRLELTNVTIALKSIFTLYKLIKKFKPDLVYIPVASNFLPYLRDGLFILISSYFSEAKIVIHLHEGDYFRTGFYKHSNAFIKYFIRKSLVKVDTAIVLGERLRFVFKDLVKSTEVCPNGIKSEFGSHIQIENSTKEKIRIGFLGNLFESKGVLDVINAAVIVLKEKQNVEFIIAGLWTANESNTKYTAEKIISDNDLNEKIKFTGMITGKEKSDFFRNTDIFVFPSWYRYEGFPLVIIEAMSASLPVISVKDTGAIPDIITDKETGILIEKKDPVRISEAVLYLINNPEIRTEMGRKGKDKFEKNFTLKINISNMIRVFNKVLN